jgi:hypothetical protein
MDLEEFSTYRVNVTASYGDFSLSLRAGASVQFTTLSAGENTVIACIVFAANQ